MNCKKCGTIINTFARHCSACGSVTTREAEEKTNSYSKRRSVLLMFFVLLLAGGSVVGYRYYLSMPKAGTVRVNPADGAEMVYVPAGEFLMGGDPKKDKYDPSKPDDHITSAEMPLHTVYIDGFWIYKTEVTVAQYRAFCRSSNRQMPKLPDEQTDQYPISNINWFDADAYAHWANAALPTEAQWEKAARGTKGQSYPWGDAWDDARYACIQVRDFREVTTPYKGLEYTLVPCPVGSRPAGASPYGALDMMGNVGEWCADWGDTAYYATSPKRNPMGPAHGKMRIFRSCGGYITPVDPKLRIPAIYTRQSYPPSSHIPQLGFRCVVRSPRKR